MKSILFLMSLLLATVIGAQETNYPASSEHEGGRSGGGVSSGSIPVIPIEESPRLNIRNDGVSKTVPALEQFPEDSNNSKRTKVGQNTPLSQETSSATGNFVASKSGLEDLLPWCLAVFMAVLAGATGTYIIILKKQERHFVDLREDVLRGSRAVHLLPEEATRLIQEFHRNVKEGANYFADTVKRQRQELEQVIGLANEMCRASHEETKSTVDTFKGSLNEMLGKISKFMERVVQDTKETHNQALETKDFAKQVSSLIQDKELEISKLKEGYHLQLISPLTKAFLTIRDDIHLLADHIGDAQIRQQLSDFDQQIGNALADLKIEEIPILVGQKPHEIHHSRLWESLGAAVPTNDPVLHGAIARIQARGYQLSISNDEPHIIRKAVLVIQNYSPVDGQSEGEPSSQGPWTTFTDSKI
jgi:hypothetical protein